MKNQLVKVSASVFNDGTVLFNFHRKNAKGYKTYRRDTSHKFMIVLQDLSYSNTTNLVLSANCVYFAIHLDNSL